MIFFIPTFRRDEGKCIYTVASIMKNCRSLSTVVVMYDVSSGSQPTQQWIDRLHNVCNTYGGKCVVECTSFKRRGNLNGTECISELIGIYQKYMNQEDDNLMMKMDSDCMFFNSRFINNFQASDKLLGGQLVFGPPPPIGNCIAGASYIATRECIEMFRDLFPNPSALSALCEQISTSNPEWRELMQGYKEDYVLSCVAINRMPSNRLSFTSYTPELAFLAGFQYNDMSENKQRVYQSNFDIVTYGNRFLIKPTVGDVDSYIEHTMGRAMELNIAWTK